jgi:SAM-dependent methyltransferase
VTRQPFSTISTPNGAHDARRLVYDSGFFDYHEEPVRRSAQNMVPTLVDLFKPQSVVDVGCGTGIWLATFKAFGVEEVLGVDGPWVPRARLKIPPDRFVSHDLSKPFSSEMRYDLVVCVEVAEHLPESAASQLVETITSLGSAVVFSAAIPGQGGTDHLNEQWPSYWIEMFNARGFKCLDHLRKVFWSNVKIECYYRQNILAFISNDREDLLHAFDCLNDAASLVNIVHPEVFRDVVSGRDHFRMELGRVTNSRAWRAYQSVRTPLVRAVQKARALVIPH